MDAWNLKFGSSVPQAGNVSGHVQDIGFMQTRVQGFDGVPVLVPNQAFTSQVLNSSFLKSPNCAYAFVSHFEESGELSRLFRASLIITTKYISQYWLSKFSWSKFAYSSHP